MRHLFLPLLLACQPKTIFIDPPQSEEDSGPHASGDWEEQEDPGYPDDEEASPSSYEREGNPELCQTLYDSLEEVRGDVELQLSENTATWDSTTKKLSLSFDQLSAPDSIALYPCVFSHNYFEGKWDFGGWYAAHLSYKEGEGETWYEYPEITVQLSTTWDPSEIPSNFSYRFLIEDGNTSELKWLAGADYENSKVWVCELREDSLECS